MNPSVRRDTEFAILGLLAISPKTGYDIKRCAETTLAHFWNESYGNIYPLLRRLHQDGLTKKKAVASEKGPEKIVYSITADGMSEFLEWLQQPVEPVSPKNTFLLKLFFGQFSNRESVVQLLQHYRDQISQMQTFLSHKLREIRSQESTDPGFPYWELTMDCGLNSMKSITRWCDRSIEKLEKMSGGKE